MNQIDQALHGVRVALAESRELDLFADMLRSRGADTLRCPLVTIRDTPDAAQVGAWLDRFIRQPPDWLILLTGEGLRRLAGFAERSGRAQEFARALRATRTLTRGPKPGRALRAFGLKPDQLAESPTTAGVIRTLAGLDLNGKRVGVQLYGQETNPPLMTALAEAGASSEPVAPYVYENDMGDPQVLGLLDALEDGAVQVIAFTSKSQVERLFAVATNAGREQALKAALDQLLVASVGPVVSDTLTKHGIKADLQPADSFFMKPLVREIMAAQTAGRI